MTEGNKQPAGKVSIFPIYATIWRNEKDGRPFYSVTTERRYKDNNGDWKTSNSYNANHLLILAKVADQAHSEIERLRANDSGEQSEDAA